MRFRPYAKMPAAGETREHPSPGGTWVALEKIHGAQLVVAVQGKQLRFGKRKAWLTEEEPFFGWQLLRVQLGAAAQAVARAVSGPLPCWTVACPLASPRACPFSLVSEEFVEESMYLLLVDGWCTHFSSNVENMTSCTSRPARPPLPYSL